MFDALRQRFTGLTAVQSYLDAVQADMVEHAEELRKQDESMALDGMAADRRSLLYRYSVNALISNGNKTGAPLVSEHNPTYSNLMGRVEHLAQWGALITDFTLIKPGALFDVTEITPTVAPGRRKQRLEQIHRVCCAIDGLKHRVDQSIVLQRSDALQ